MQINLNLIGKEKAEAVCRAILGRPTENRIVLAAYKGAKTTDSGLYIPDTAKEGVPRKGVVVALGEITEGYQTYSNIQVGDVVTYGLYAGKELEPIMRKGELNYNKTLLFTVLSLNEVIFVEPNME